MIVGAIGLIYGFLSAPSSIEDVKEIIASHEAHGEGHASAEEATHHVNGIDAEKSQAVAATGEQAADAHSDEDAHAEHMLHQLQNKPWAATYVAAFFFFMIALGALAFYAVPICSYGWLVACFV